MAYVQLPNQNRLSGINTLAYMGAEATTPPQFVIEKRDPTVNDYQGWRLGSEWLNNVNRNVWKLVALGSKTATWVRTAPAGIQQLVADDANAALPIAGSVNILGGTNMHTEAVAPLGDTIAVNVIDHPSFATGLTVNALAAPGVVMTDAAGLFNSTNGGDGKIIVARAAGPMWADIVSAGGSVLITASVDPMHPGAINLEAAGGGGGGGAGGLTADIGGTALPRVLAPFYIDVFGSDVIKTNVTGPNTLTIDIEDSAAAGEVVLGGGPGVASSWGRLYSSNLSVVVTPGIDPLNPLKHAINLTVAGGAGAFGGLKDTAGAIAVPDIANTVQLIGAGGITTTTAGSTITITAGAPNLDGRVLISTAGGPATWRTLLAGANVTITEGNDGSGRITISAVGGGALGGIQQLDCDSGIAVNPVTNIMRLEGYHGTYNIDHTVHPYQNIFTSSTAGIPDLVNLRLTSTIQLPLTNAGGTAGMIMIGVNDFMHAYGTHSTFLGELAGNRTMNAGNSGHNVAIGYNAFRHAVDYADFNVAVGYGALGSYTTPAVHVGLLPYAYNTALGAQALSNLDSGHGCIGIGRNAGQQLVGNISHVIAIGSIAAGATSGDIYLGEIGTHLKCYVAGITGATTAASDLMLVGVNGRLESVATPAAAVGEFLGVRPGFGAQWRTMASASHTVRVTDPFGDGNINLETSNLSTFMDAYPTNTTNVTGDLTKYYLGEELAKPLNLVNNVGGGVFFAGGVGVPASFTIPEIGYYLLTFNIRLNGLRTSIVLPPPPPPAPAAYDPVTIEHSRGGLVINEWAHYPSLSYDGYSPYVSDYFSVMKYLVAGDIIRWYIQVDYRPGESVGGAWPLSYNTRLKCIGIDSTSGTLNFSQVGIAKLV